MDMQRDDEDPVALLRAATRVAHRKVESHALMRPLVTGAGLERGYYRKLLQAFHAYYHSLERELCRPAPQVLERDPYSDYFYRPRAPLLKADLEDLGAPATAASAMPSPPLPPLQSMDQVLGVLYVIEGATRGGRVIAPRLARSLGVGADWAGRFFSLDVDDARETHWSAFCVRLRRSAPGADADAERPQAMFDAARQTFDSLSMHLDRYRVAG